MRSALRVLVALLALTGSTFVGAAAGQELAAPMTVPPPGDYTGPSADQLPADMHLFGDDTHHQCGKYALVFRNKDLREDANDRLHAQGQFFIQFQAVGKGSHEITRFSFDFGATTDQLHQTPAVNCNQALPPSPAGQGTSGAYIMYYRSDFDGRDGFFVPILTNNVPDGEYAAAVHAYSGDCNPVGPSCIEVARAWARAIVDNCPTDLPGDKGISAYGCAQDAPADVIKKDHTLPWPMVLPGDGEQTNDVPGLTVEFPEPMIKESVHVYDNGRELTMSDWTPPQRDSDVTPLNDATPCPAGQEIRIVCERMQYGPGFKWEGSVQKGDVLRVQGQDLNFNFLERTVHVGAATSGGWVESTAPELTMEVLNDDDVFIRPGDHHEFNVRLANIGGGQGVIGLVVNITTQSGTEVSKTGFESHWTDVDGNRVDGVTLDRGEERTLKVSVNTQKTTPTDHYTVFGIVEYDVDGVQQYKSFDAIVDVNPNASGNHQHLHGLGIPTTAATNATNATALTVPKGDGSPGLGAASLLAGTVAVLAVVAWRRRAG